jgi:hypothetical protein
VSSPPVSATDWSIQTVLACTKDIYMLSPLASDQSAWTQSLLHHYPAELWEFRWPLAVDKNGAIYGTTAKKIFRLIPPTANQAKWRSVILMSFSKKNCVQNGPGLFGRDRRCQWRAVQRHIPGRRKHRLRKIGMRHAV